MNNYNYLNYNNTLLADNSDKYWRFGHICLLVFGMVFFVSSALHKSMWFDEAYTVAMLRHDFFRICEITARDVHPPLYYLIAKLSSLIWGQSIVVYRLVSVAGMVLFSLLGYTHIRKILGNQTGFYYTFLAIFLPVMLEYSGEARMYSWAMFFTTAAGIYACLSFKQNQLKCWVLFALFSLFGAYTHYYALLGIIFINLVLLALIVFQKKYLLKQYALALVAQIVFYLPWAFILINQIISVTNEYWIVINYQYLLRDFSVFYFAEHLPEYAAQLLSIVVLLGCFFGVFKAVSLGKRHVGIVLAGLFIYLAVIVSALVFSALVKPIFIARYLMPNSGFLLIALAWGLASLTFFKRQVVSALLCLVVLAASFTNFYFNYVKVYSPLNYALENNIAESLQPDDIFLYTDIHPAGIYSVLFPNNKHYVFFPSDNEEPDSKPNPFQPELKIISNLKGLNEYQGRIWLVENSYSQYLYGRFGENKNLFTVIDYARVYDNMPYLSHKGFRYVCSLLKKEAGPAPDIKY